MVMNGARATKLWLRSLVGIFLLLSRSWHFEAKRSVLARSARRQVKRGVRPIIMRSRSRSFRARLSVRAP